MKIASTMLGDFLKRATIDSSIAECRIQFTDTGIVIEAADEPQHKMVHAELGKKAFKGYKTGEAIGIQDVRFLRSVVGSFDEDIDFVVDNNKLTIKGESKKAEIILANIKLIKELPNFPDKIEADAVFDVESKVLKSALSNADIVGKETEIIFEAEKGILYIETGGDNKITEKLSVPQIKSELKVTFDEPMKEVIKVLDGKVNINMKSKYPCKLITKDDFISCAYVIAPRFEE